MAKFEEYLNESAGGNAVMLTLKVPVNKIVNMVKLSGARISDKAMFRQYITTPKFAKDLAADILLVWELANEEGFENVQDMFPEGVISWDDED